jgi:hypothetical protein
MYQEAMGIGVSAEAAVTFKPYPTWAVKAHRDWATDAGTKTSS